MKAKKTSIEIDADTWRLLISLKELGETFDHLIKRLVASHWKQQQAVKE